MTERHDLKRRLKDLVAELAALDGVAGHEQPVVARLVELLELWWAVGILAGSLTVSPRSGPQRSK